MNDAIYFPLRERIFIHDIDGHRIFLDTNDLHMTCHMLENRVWEPHIREVLFESLQYSENGSKDRMTYVDVGSNIGLHTVYAAGLVGQQGKIYAIEPNHSVFEILKNNMDINGFLDQTVFFEGAISNYEGKGTIYIYEGHAGGSGLGQEIGYQSGCQKQEVPVMTLDDIVGGDAVDVLKIDVEGFEKNVLEGSKKVLEQNQDRITVIIEWQPDDMRKRIGKDAPAAILDMMMNYDFQCYQANFMEKLVKVDMRTSRERLINGIRADLIFTKKTHLEKLCVVQEEQHTISFEDKVEEQKTTVEYEELKKELDFSKQAFKDAVVVQENLKKEIEKLNESLSFSEQAFRDAVAVQELLKRQYEKPTVKEALCCMKNCFLNSRCR